MRARKILAASCVAAVALATAHLLPTTEIVYGCIRSDVWPRSLIYLHACSDALIALAYAWIPLTLLLLWRARRDIPVDWTLGCFAAFIVLCGVGHAVDILTIWRPMYWLSGEIRAATALVSLATAALLRFRVLPLLLAIPDGKAVAEARAAAEREANEARKARDDLVALNAILQRQAEDLQVAAAQARSQDAAIRELSTPVLLVQDRVLLSPIVGALDSSRAAGLATRILDAVREQHAKTVILDLAGVALVDTAVASELLGVAQAVRLLGAKCVITGIRGPVAQAIVALGIDLSTITTRATVRDALSSP